MKRLVNQNQSNYFELFGQESLLRLELWTFFGFMAAFVSLHCLFFNIVVDNNDVHNDMQL